MLIEPLTGMDGAQRAAVLDGHGWCQESSGFYQTTWLMGTDGER